MNALPAYLQAAAQRHRWQRLQGERQLAGYLPEPYPLQAAIIEHPAKRKVVVAGRRGGKTHMAALLAVKRFLAGQRVLLSSTSQDQADVFWRYITKWLRPLLATLYKNETLRVLRWGEAEIRVKTGSDADALRGDHVDLLVLDEAARLAPTAWFEVGAPMLLDTHGDAVFISTPKRRNWFFHLFAQAATGDDPHWHAWHFPTTANPYITPEALALLTADMTEDAYRQEILAEFLEGQGAVFRHIDERCTAQRVEPYAGQFVAGLDWAQQSDFTVLVVLDAARRVMVDYDRFNGVEWALQRGRVRTLADKWGVQTIIAESNSIGGPNIEALLREGLPVTPFETTATSKPPLIESLVLAFDRGDLTALDDATLKGELMAFERRVLPSGRSQYSAPDGLHDDLVIALALAWHGVVRHATTAMQPNPFYE